MTERSVSYWIVQGPGWVLLLYLLYAQAIPAFDYQLGVRMGTQESAENVTEVGAAFWYGFAFADLITYIPLLAAGLVGHRLACRWGPMVLSAALGITVYWPVVCLATVVAASDAAGWSLSNENNFWIALPLIASWGAFGLWYLLSSNNHDH